MSINLKNLIFPRDLYCIVCGKYIDHTRKYGLCDHCIKRMNFGCTEFVCENFYHEAQGSPYFDYGFSAMGYGLYERRLIFNLKYDGKTYMAPILADIIYDAIYKKVSEAYVEQGDKNESFSDGIFDVLAADLIIPVPIHKKRINERGFNQSEKVAYYLSRKLAIPVDTRTLIRDKETHTQRALSAEDRRKNMEGVFVVPKGMEECISNKNIILLDDIYTTGATVTSCTKTLKQKGAKKIYVLTLLFAGNRHHLMIE